MLMNKKRLLSSVLLISILTANVKANHYSFDKNTTDETDIVLYVLYGSITIDDTPTTPEEESIKNYILENKK